MPRSGQNLIVRSEVSADLHTELDGSPGLISFVSLSHPKHKNTPQSTLSGLVQVTGQVQAGSDFLSLRDRQFVNSVGEEKERVAFITSDCVHCPADGGFKVLVCLINSMRSSQSELLSVIVIVIVIVYNQIENKSVVRRKKRSQ